MSRYTWRTGLLEGVMIAVSLLFLFPIYIIINIAFTKNSDLSSPLAPTLHPTLGNFGGAWRVAGLLGALLNSAIVMVASVVLVVLISATAAYPLARITARWSRLVFALFMLGLLLPMQLGMIPLYETMHSLGLVGSVWALVIYYAGLLSPFSILLYTAFLRSIPREYEEAAMIDGAGPVRTFWLVILPMLRAVTGTVAILNAIGVWNDFFVPLIYLNGSATPTVPVALYAFVGQYFTNWHLVFAGLIIAVIPILTIYFLMQRHIIRSFAGGLKG